MNLQQYIQTLRERSEWNLQAAAAAHADGLDYLFREHAAIAHTQYSIAEQMSVHPVDDITDRLFSVAAYNIRCAEAPTMEEGDILEYLAIGSTQANIASDLQQLLLVGEVPYFQLD